MKLWVLLVNFQNYGYFIGFIGFIGFTGFIGLVGALCGVLPPPPSSTNDLVHFQYIVRDSRFSEGFCMSFPVKIPGPTDH